MKITLELAAMAFADALRVAIASGEYSANDVQHMKRLLGNVEKVVHARD